MDEFEKLLHKTGEVGYVERVSGSVVHVDGLPGAKLKEMVVFERGQSGQVLAMDEKSVQVMMLSRGAVKVGSRVARSGRALGVVVGDFMLGKVVDGLGGSKGVGKGQIEGGEWREIDVEPLGVSVRASVARPLETGVKVVDMVVPLGMGQRELVLGDRKTGKSSFLFQVMMSQARKGLVCVYGAVGRSEAEIARLVERLEEFNLTKQVVVVASKASDATGLVFTAPYTAMTTAEYFRDKGRDVLVILDDLTTHARYYREIALLARRFPGRNSYPGDIFYVHSRLLERAGSFLVKTEEGKEKEVSITCLPSAESVLGDMSGYIQTNLMAMTDGHLFFDRDLYNLGQRPAVSPFLSVTRVGEQAQSKLMRELSLQLSSFLTKQREVEGLMHFGAELSTEVKRVIKLGGRMRAFLNQDETEVVSTKIGAVMLALLLGGVWKGTKSEGIVEQTKLRVEAYEKDSGFRERIDRLFDEAESFKDLVDRVRMNESMVLGGEDEVVEALEQKVIRPYSDREVKDKVLAVGSKAGIVEKKGRGETGKALNR